MLFKVFFTRALAPRLTRAVLCGGALAALLFATPASAQETATTTATVTTSAATPAPTHQTHHKHHHAAAKTKAKPKQETDFDCAVHTAYGEARNTSREEEAVVINLLVERARLEKLSICRAAHKYFKPRHGSTPGIVAAAKNVLQGDKSLVPAKFAHATEMRAYRAPKPPADKFRSLGSVSQKPGNGLHGNVFFEARGNAPAVPEEDAAQDQQPAPKEPEQTTEK